MRNSIVRTSTVTQPYFLAPSCHDLVICPLAVFPQERLHFPTDLTTELSNSNLIHLHVFTSRPFRFHTLECLGRTLRNGWFTQGLAMLELSRGWLEALSHQAGTFSAAEGLPSSPVPLAFLGRAALASLRSLLEPLGGAPLGTVCDPLLCFLHLHLFLNAICFLSALLGWWSVHLPVFSQLPSCFLTPTFAPVMTALVSVSGNKIFGAVWSSRQGFPSEQKNIQLLACHIWQWLCRPSHVRVREDLRLGGISISWPECPSKQCCNYPWATTTITDFQSCKMNYSLATQSIQLP